MGISIRYLIYTVHARTKPIETLKVKWIELMLYTFTRYYKNQHWYIQHSYPIVERIPHNPLYSLAVWLFSFWDVFADPQYMVCVSFLGFLLIFPIDQCLEHISSHCPYGDHSLLRSITLMFASPTSNRRIGLALFTLLRINTMPHLLYPTPHNLRTMTSTYKKHTPNRTQKAFENREDRTLYRPLLKYSRMVVLTLELGVSIPTLNYISH